MICPNCGEVETKPHHRTCSHGCCDRGYSCTAVDFRALYLAEKRRADEAEGQAAAMAAAIRRFADAKREEKAREKDYYRAVDANAPPPWPAKELNQARIDLHDATRDLLALSSTGDLDAHRRKP